MKVSHAVLLAVVLLSGCNALHTHCGHKDVVEIVPQSDTIIVGGYVQQPGDISLVGRKLSLSDAINLAGGIRSSIGSASPTVSNKLLEIKRVHQGLTELFNEFRTAYVEYSEADESALEAAKLRYFQTRNTLNNSMSKIELTSQELRISEYDPILAKLFRDLESDWDSIDDELQAFTDDPARELMGVIDPVLDSMNQIIQGLDERMSSLSIHNLTVPVQVETETQYLIGFRRIATMPRVTYFMPYAQAMRGVASGIQLEPGDSIKVVPLEETSLFVNSNGSAEAAASPAGELGDQVTLNAISQRYNNSALTTVLIRPAGDLSGKDVYLLPTELTTLGVNQGGYADVALSSLDRIDVTPTFTAPLYADTVIGSIVADVIADRTRITRPDFDHSQATISGLQTAGDSFVRNIATGLNRLIGF